MRAEIKKEHTYLFAPNINVAVMVQISGGVTPDALEAAIARAVFANEILHCVIEIGADGAAYYSKAAAPVYSFTVTDLDWKAIIRQQDAIPFQFRQGELIRFFAIPREDAVQLVMVAHHFAGDGLSFALLLEDIMNALAGNPLPDKPLQLYSMERLSKECRLNPLLRFMIKRLNKKWDKTGKSFTADDYHRMFKAYWATRENVIFHQSIRGDKLHRLLEQSKAHSVTLNSAITTAFIKAAGKKQDVGMGASIRPTGFKGMGNYATGISVQYCYNGAKDFWSNAQRVHQLIYRKLNDNHRKYFLLKFISELRPTLIDAAYFAAYDGYRNQAAEAVQRMFGYNGTPKGISLSNLGKIPISSRYKGYSISDVTFIPPFVSNARRMIGIATLEDTLTISMQVENNGLLSSEQAFYERAMEGLLR